MNLSLVLPIPHYAAHAWAQGWIGDVELMLGPHPDGAALYVQTLPDLAAWRVVLPDLVKAARAGASAVVLRTDAPAVVHHVEKWGAHRTFQDKSGRWRYYAGPEVVTRYFGRMAQKSAAASAVTTSR